MFEKIKQLKKRAATLEQTTQPEDNIFFIEFALNSAFNPQELSKSLKFHQQKRSARRICS
jgi:TPP-dependent 2-oxoacid decarboxylase